MRFIILLLSIVSGSLTVTAQTTLSLLGHLSMPNGVKCSNITGYVDSLGNEYALVGTTQGVSVVNISDPANPFQRFLIPGAIGQQQDGEWRELREYKGYAYIVTEQNLGLVVADLTHLPDTIRYHTMRPYGMASAHSIFIDEKGIAYLNGVDRSEYQILLDLNANLWSPVQKDLIFNIAYIHDCYVRHDTMWAAYAYDGYIEGIDIKNSYKSIGAFSTPGSVSHNCWLSDDSKYLFTTDETPGSYITCYDVSKPNNVIEKSRVRTLLGANAMLHNVYYLNDFCIASAYSYGIAIFDVLHKNNMVEVAHYDTSPNTGTAFTGAWGVWPYLPSGNIIVSDIETGLYILKPTYKRTCHFEGEIRDLFCGSKLSNVSIQVIGDSTVNSSDFQGKYASSSNNGTHRVRFTKNGYEPREVDIELIPDSNIIIILRLMPIGSTPINVKTVDSATLAPAPWVRIIAYDTTLSTRTGLVTEDSGSFRRCNFESGEYIFYAATWSILPKIVRKNISLEDTSLYIPVQKGYYDDFTLYNEWTTSGSTKNENRWSRIDEFSSYPSADVTTDFGKYCFVTGITDDVDSIYTTLCSPPFNLTDYKDPYIHYSRFFYNSFGGTKANDSMIITLHSGTDSTVIDIATGIATEWLPVSIRVKDFVSLSDSMYIKFKVQDTPPDSYLKAAIDVFSITDSIAPIVTSNQSVTKNTSLQVYPNPFNNTITISANNEQPLSVELFNTLGELITRQQLSGRNNYQFQTSSNLAAGIYLLKITGEQIQETHRLIKIK